MDGVPCRMPDCPNRAEEWTVGARKQGGRYDLCEAHLEALAQRARDTRKANREAREREAEMREEELRTLGAVGKAEPGNEIANNPTPEIREDPPVDAPRELTVYGCPRDDVHEEHQWELIEGEEPFERTSTLYQCPGRDTAPVPDEESERRGHADGCMLDSDHDGECYVAGEPDGTPARWIGADGHEAVRPEVRRLPPSSAIREALGDHEPVGTGFVTLEAERETLAERVLGAWVGALVDAYSALGCELAKPENPLYNATHLAEHVERLLRHASGLSIACDLLAGQPVDEVPSAE